MTDNRDLLNKVEKNIKKLKDLYELGYTDAQIHYDALISFLKD